MSNRGITIVDCVENAPKALRIKYAQTTHVITEEMIHALNDGKMLAFDSGDAAEYIRKEKRGE